MVISTTIFLHEAEDAEDSFAIALPGDTEGAWRAGKGFGQKFKRAWTVEFQSDEPLPMQAVDWDAVLVRAIEAYSMNDPVITNYRWPLLGRQSARSPL